VHWTTDLWKCAYCGVEINQAHLEGCATRNTDSAVIWFGPPVTPGMLPRLVVEGDITASAMTCTHCEDGFKPGEVIFENRSQLMGIHGRCILLLAQMVPREMPTPHEIETEFERRRAEISDGS